MCYACKTEQEFQEVVEELRDELKEEEVQFFPRVFVIGKTEKIVAFYVVTSSMQFKLPSFLRCIDLVVKLKFVLNYNFPESCELFWYFVAKYFYHIGYSRKAKNSQLLQLLAYLEHWESITCTAICAITSVQLSSWFLHQLGDSSWLTVFKYTCTACVPSKLHQNLRRHVVSNHACLFISGNWWQRRSR